MSSKSHQVLVERHARVHTAGDPRTASEVWFLLHGYGQLAAEFLESCGALEGPGRLLVAPEALSRFYLRSGEGPVGASWMTREERASEIADHVAYLDRVAQWVEDELGGRSNTRVVLGFSQGSATAWRWAALGSTPVEQVISFGGGVPPELDLTSLAAKSRSLRATLVRGKADAWFAADAARRDLGRFVETGLAAELIEFDGGHAVEPAWLAHVAAARARR